MRDAAERLPKLKPENLDDGLAEVGDKVLAADSDRVGDDGEKVVLRRLRDCLGWSAFRPSEGMLWLLLVVAIGVVNGQRCAI